jgi:hypothetical protein
MIREKAIFFKLNSLNSSDSDLFRLFTPSKEDCPKCRALSRLKPHASYERDLISIHDGRRREDRVRIKRVLCKSCITTHALLPDILIPKSSYTLRFIIYVLRAYLNRSGTVEELCSHYQISISTLYRWKKRFRDHANLLLLAFNQISQVTIRAIDSVGDIEALPGSFFNKFGFSFLQNHERQFVSPGAG